jgi:hypothetical protein
MISQLKPEFELISLQMLKDGPRVTIMCASVCRILEYTWYQILCKFQADLIGLFVSFGDWVGVCQREAIILRLLWYDAKQCWSPQITSAEFLSIEDSW